MKHLLTIFIVSILFIAPINAQGTAGEGAQFEYRYLIDRPATGILKKGFVGVSNDVMPYGVLITKIEVGAFEGMSFGISYGGENIIGSGAPTWYKTPGVSLRVRIFEESLTFPNITLGFDSQGRGKFFRDQQRYAVKSPGFFAAGSKNFKFLGYMSLHSSVNYSLESSDGENFVNMSVGIEKTVGQSVSFVSEYDFAFNDNADISFGKGNGYLNFGVRWSVGEGLTLGMEFRDLFSNKSWNAHSADRSIHIEYIRSIF